MSNLEKSKVTRILAPALICNMLAFTSILPLLPKIMVYYSKDGYRDWLYDRSVQGLEYFQNAIGVPRNEGYDKVFFGGLLGSLFSALQFLSAPTLGALSDVYGRRAIIILCGLCTLISYVYWFNAKTFSCFVLCRIIGGLSKGNINVAISIISDVYGKNEHQKGMSLIGISYSLGFLIGPMIGAFFSSIAPLETPFTLPALFSIFLTVVELIFLFFLPETLKESSSKKINEIESTKHLILLSDLFQFSAVKASQKNKTEIQNIGRIYFIYLFLYSGLEFTLPFLTHIRFDYNSMQQGKIYLFTGLLMLPFQGLFVRRIPIERQKNVAEFGVTCIIPAYILVAFANSQFLLYSGLFFYAIASATVVSSLTSVVHTLISETENGVLAGVFRSIGCLARATGPIFSSTCFWLLGPTSCYLIGACLLSIPLILLKKTVNPVIKIKN